VGGRGSGRRPGFSTTLNDYHAIAIPCLRRYGLLQPGSRGSLHWSRAGRETGSVGVVASQDTVTLIYRVQDHGADTWTDTIEVVGLLRTPQHFGGERLWFACPGCGRRCAVLYGGRRFLCRRCVAMPYASQNEAVQSRLVRRAQAIRKRVGGSEYANLSLDFPPKPKRMHWKTYSRLQAAAERFRGGSLRAVARRLGLLGDRPGDMRMR
jgi:hypothetical protein